MGAGFHYPPAFEHYNLIGIFYCAQPVGYHQYSAAFEERVEVGHYYLFVVGIEGAGSFVKKNKRWVFIHSPRYQQALLLPLAQAHAIHANLCIVAQGQTLNKPAYVGYVNSVVQFFRDYFFFAQRNIAGNGVGEHIPILHYRAAALAPPASRDFASQPVVAGKSGTAQRYQPGGGAVKF
jgi:hypothetical protein